VPSFLASASNVRIAEVDGINFGSCSRSLLMLGTPWYFMARHTLQKFCFLSSAFQQIFCYE